MSAYTAEALADKLAEDLVWRKKELTVLRRLLASASDDRKSVLVRSLVAIVYAHWEGFLKSAARVYVEYVKARRLSYSELATNFVAQAVLPRMRRAVEQRDAKAVIELVQFLRGDMKERSRLSVDEVGGGSNLSSRMLRTLTITLGLDYKPFESKAFLIDTRLLENRNRIAHGDYIALSVEDALELATEIMALMECFRDEVENAVALSRYRQSGTAEIVSSAL